MPTPYQNHTSPVCKRFAEDLLIRNKAINTINAYTYHVSRFEKFMHPIPLKQVTPEHVRNFQLHLIKNEKVGYSNFNQAVCALRFLYNTTLPRNWPVVMIPYGKRPKTLPTVLSQQEVHSLIQCTPYLKHKTILLTLYATGIRISELTALKIPDIDSQRMQLNIRHGKGNKQRQVPISPRLLSALRLYWQEYQPQTLLFPGKDPSSHYAHTTIQKFVRKATRQANIQKKVTPHTLRHSYATGLLEAGVDILTISRLLGHASLMTTMVYLHVRRTHMLSTPSPLDWLPVDQLPKWENPDQNQN